jgi:hypothetical protein
MPYYRKLVVDNQNSIRYILFILYTYSSVLGVVHLRDEIPEKVSVDLMSIPPLIFRAVRKGILRLPSQSLI